MKYLITEVVEICDKFVVVETNNIGYQLFVINSLDFELNKEYKFFIQQEQKLDKNSKIVTNLFGFLEKQQLNFFVFLLSAHGIGNKIALNILKNNIADICRLIKNQDIEGLVRIKGITLRIATSIIEEVNKSKKNNSLINDKYFQDPNNTPIYDEIVDALKQIGYDQIEIKDCMKKLLKDASSINNLDDAINKCIKIIISMKSSSQKCNI